MKRLFAVLLILFAALLEGCATSKPMAFQSVTSQVTPSTPPIFLMSVTLTNSYKPRFQLELKSVFVERLDSAGKPTTLRFAMDREGTIDSEVDDAPPTYFVRMALEPGTYVLRGMGSTARAFPVIGNFLVPLHSPLVSDVPGIFYLGHVDATVRERVDEEFKAGPSIPLIDQAAAGAFGGTFDIRISDQFVGDEPVLRTNFPQLKDAALRKAILPPFDRAAAQKWWQEH